MELKQKNVLIIAADGFQEDEFFRPLEDLRSQGAEVHVASMKTEPISASEKSTRSYRPELTFDQVDVSKYDALVIPGGLKNPDTLRQQERAVQIVRDFDRQGKPIAAICHGPWMLVEADIVKGRELTSYPSIRTDLRNAGAKWTDGEVVVDRNLVTSRKPSDLDAFIRQTARMLSETNVRRRELEAA